MGLGLIKYKHYNKIVEDGVMDKRSIICLFLLIFVFSGCSSTGNLKPSRYSSDKPGGVRGSYVNIDGKKIHYIETGKGEPVVLVHGWICSGGMWDKTIKRLQSDYHVYAIDLMGHGLSQRMEDRTYYTTEKQSDMVAGFIKKISPDAPVLLVGHSMGGETVARVALKVPEKVKKLVMVDAAGLKENPEKLPFLTRIAFKWHMERFAFSLANSETTYWAFRRFMYYYENDIDQVVVDQLYGYNLESEGSADNAAAITRMGLFYSFIDEKVKKMKVPTLLVWGEKDLVVPLDLGRQYDRLIPNSRLVIIKKGGHMVFDEHPDRFTKELVAFFNEPQKHSK